MNKGTFLVTRIVIAVTLIALGLMVVWFGLTNYYFENIYSAAYYTTLTGSIGEAEQLLGGYQAGEIDLTALEKAVNPELNAGHTFYMLLDADGTLLACTEEAGQYVTDDTLENILHELDQNERTWVRVEEDKGTTVMIGVKTAYGYVVVSRPLRIYSGFVKSFRTRMLITLLIMVAVFLAAGMLLGRHAWRPTRIITEMAGKLVRGEQVTLPETLPGAESREIAVALNHMSRSVSQAIGDLKYEKETMALILEGLSEGILAVDEQGRILHENEAAWQLLGGEETAAYRAALALLSEAHDEDQWEGKFTLGDRVLYIGVSRLPHEDGADRGRVALIRDITEQERLERTRHDYVANISHELRTPLASIRGLGEGLRDGLVSEDKDRQRYYSIIVDETNRLSRLVNDLLELSSLQSNPAAFETERVDPNELMYELHDRNGSLFTDKHITFLRSLPEEPLPCFRSNEDRLSQVLTIFLDNARKYTPAGGAVTLGAERTAGGTRFFVRDTGIGMDEETQRLAFDRFHQAECGRSDQGSGLGLSIAKEILQKMGVSIALSSAPGQGSEFSFVIPDETA